MSCMVFHLHAAQTAGLACGQACWNAGCISGNKSRAFRAIFHLHACDGHEGRKLVLSHADMLRPLNCAMLAVPLVHLPDTTSFVMAFKHQFL